MDDHRPNILFLMSDQHRFDISGFMGNGVVRTPLLDRLSREAVIFDNAYCPSPICIPGRQALATGQFPRHCGSESFLSDIAPGSMTFSRRLSQWGYFTCCAGKLHHHGQDQMQGWQKRIAPDTEIHPVFIEGLVANEWERWKKPDGIGKFSNQKEIERAGVGKSPLESNDDLTLTASLNFLERYFADPYYDRPQSCQPLLFKVSFNNPHYPYLTSKELFNYYLNRVPIYNRHERFDHPILAQTQSGPHIHVNDRDCRRATAAYYGMIESLDERFCKIIDKLEELGENIDDWLIIYTSDHGDMLGEHGVWEKTSFFEGSVRVPLFIRYPQKWRDKYWMDKEDRLSISQNVSTCDLFATLCDYTGITMPSGTDSRSLMSLVQRDSDDWFNESVSQYAGTLMIKMENLKYCYYEKLKDSLDAEVLFDLEKDPQELYNVITMPEYTEQIKRFRKKKKELKY